MGNWSVCQLVNWGGMVNRWQLAVGRRQEAKNAGVASGRHPVSFCAVPKETGMATGPGQAVRTPEFFGDAGPATGGPTPGTADALSATQADPSRALGYRTGPVGALWLDDQRRALE